MLGTQGRTWGKAKDAYLDFLRPSDWKKKQCKRCTAPNKEVGYKRFLSLGPVRARHAILWNDPMSGSN